MLLEIPNGAGGKFASLRFGLALDYLGEADDGECRRCENDYSIERVWKPL